MLWGLAGMVMGGWAVDPPMIEQGDNRDSGPFYPLQIETQREYFFDRPVTVPGDWDPAEGEKTIPIQRVIDMIKGDEDPDTIPGFIGSINELEGITPLRGLKHALFMTNWLLVDPGEREGGSEDAQRADYDALVKGTRPGADAGGGGVYQVTRPVSSPTYSSSYWPSTTRIPIRTANSPEPPPGRRPAEQYKDRLRIGSKDYPLIVKRLVLSPFSGGGRKADAIYYDDELNQWREVVDEEDRVNLAKAVEEGRLSIVGPNDWPKLNEQLAISNPHLRWGRCEQLTGGGVYNGNNKYE